MSVNIKENSTNKKATQLFLHGSDMLGFAYENQNNCDKAFSNISAFDTNFQNLICEKFQNENQENNYIIIDFVETASTILYEVEGKRYMNRKVLVENECNKSNTMHSKEISLLDTIEDETWHSYMDEYIACLTQYFNQEHTILVRTTIPRIRANYDIIRPFFSDDNPRVNCAVKALEDYFINKVDPYVIDLSKDYFLERDHKYPESNVCFEALYNQDLRDTVAYIISEKPEQKIYDTPNYSFTLQRFLQFYQNLYNKHMMYAVLDRNDIVNQIVMGMSKKLIAENIEDLCKLKKGNYQSFEEIENNHDFNGNQNFKDVVVIIIRIFKGDIVNPKLDYSIVFQEDLKVKKILANEVKRKLTQLDLAQDINVTIFNVETYHKALFFYLNKQYKNATKVLLNAYQESIKPVLIDSWGSCISRVPLNLDKGKYKVNTFINRCCFLNEFDEPIDASDIDFYDSTVGGGGWYNRCFRESLEKVSKNKIMESNSEWLIIDFFDTINELAVFRNAVIDFSEDNRNTDFLKKVLDECVPFSFYDKPDDYIKERMDQFIALVKNKYHDKIILVNLVVRDYYLDGRRRIKKLDAKDVEQKNEFVTKWQDYFCQETGCYCIDLAKYFLADDQSIYGASIVHYEEAFNQEVFRYVDYIMQKQPEIKLFDDYDKALKVERLIDIKSNNTDLSIVEPLFQNSEYDSYLFRLSLEQLKEMQIKEDLQYEHLCMYTIR